MDARVSCRRRLSPDAALTQMRVPGENKKAELNLRLKKTLLQNIA